MSGAFSCCCDWGTELITYVPVPIDCDNITETCDQFPDGMASVWELVIAGITDGNCTDGACDNMNGTFTFEIDSDCNFNATPTFTTHFDAVDVMGTDCRIFAGTWEWLLDYVNLGFSAGTTWYIYAYKLGAGYTTIYELDGTFDPFGSNTFNLVWFYPDGGACAGAPTTVTLEPICS